MALTIQKLNNEQTYLIFPKLPALPESAGKDLQGWYEQYQKWYDDFTRVLQKDREDTLAKINKLS